MNIQSQEYNPYLIETYYDDGSFKIQIRPKGDFDGCGDISNKDVMLFYLIYKNKDLPKYKKYLPVMDINKDGIVDERDLEIFRNIVINKKKSA